MLDLGGEYQRLGDAHTRRSNLRLVAATNRPMAALKHDLVFRPAVRDTHRLIKRHGLGTDEDDTTEA